MKKGINLIETDVEIKRAWVSALPNQQIDDPMDTTPREDERACYGSNADVMRTIGKTSVVFKVIVDYDL